MTSRQSPVSRSPIAPRRASRASAWVVTAATLLLLGSACRDIVTDDVVDVESTLCDRLEACGLEGCPAVEGFFLDGGDQEVHGFLQAFTDNACDRGCGDAPLCLDVAGICEPVGTACSADYLCCGASGGEARCEPVVDTSGDGNDGGAEGEGARACCLGLGVPCAVDSDCCLLGGEPLACRAERGGSTVPTCGGVAPCTSLDGACDEDADCCSRSCQGDRCAPIRCVGSGERCSASDTCCSATDSCIEGVCAPDAGCPGAPGCECGQQDSPCDLASESPCCEGLFCIDIGSFTPICASPDCLPNGVDCLLDEDCQCGGQRPDRGCVELASAAGGAQKVCSDQLCQPAAGGACGSEKQCCAGLSCDAADGEQGTCVPDCEPSTCQRDPFTFGVPITPLEKVQGAPDAECLSAATCASEVCALDPYCCCFLWDELCVETAGDLCSPG